MPICNLDGFKRFFVNVKSVVVEVRKSYFRFVGLFEGDHNTKEASFPKGKYFNIGCILCFFTKRYAFDFIGLKANNIDAICIFVEKHDRTVDHHLESFSVLSDLHSPKLFSIFVRVD